MARYIDESPYLESLILEYREKVRHLPNGSPAYYLLQAKIGATVRLWRALGNTLRAV